MNKKELIWVGILGIIVIGLISGCISSEDKKQKPPDVPTYNETAKEKESDIKPPNNPLVKFYFREFEEVDNYTAGNPNISRSKASKSKVLGQFGCESESPWDPKPGQAKYNKIHFSSTDNWSISIRYSCNNVQSVPISIYIDDEQEPRAIFYPQNTLDWNSFHETDKINLGAITEDYHSFTFKTDGSKYGVADLDYFILAITNISSGDDQFLDSIEKHSFLFFYENTDEHGFTIESTTWHTGSTASSGFYLTSIPIAIERGWISQDEGYTKVLTTLNSYYDDPKDPNDFYVESEHGFFPHWFYQETGKFNDVDCFSSIDTAILMAGVLTVRQYFEDTEVETLATELYTNVDWKWMLNGSDTLSMGWRPDTSFLSSRWYGYNEGMLAILLAMGSPTHSIPNESWDAWSRTYKYVEYEHKNQSYKFVESTSTALFTYQYPHIWFDLKGKTDKLGIDYFQNSASAALENRAYCIENPEKHEGYNSNAWGLTACECPLHESNYGAHGPRQNDDGTIAPAGAGGSIMFTPNESITSLHYLNETYGDTLWGGYGFKNSFNPGINWTSPTYISIDQGATMTMIENYRTGLVQKLFMQNEYADIAMQKAGFTRVNTTSPVVKQEENRMTSAYYLYVHEPCHHTCNGNKGCYDECVKHTKIDPSV